MNGLIHYKQIYYHRFDVKMSASAEVLLDAWPGAIIRNNLLYAAEQIRIQKTGRSLREQIDTIPLHVSHPLYSELKDGFPKGYVLTNFSHASVVKSPVTLHKDEVFCFSLLLIGCCVAYRYYFFEAIHEMCVRGIGKPMTPFQLLDITENGSSPVSLSSFMQSASDEHVSKITIRFLTPVILFRLREKKNTQLSYQDKGNRFPGLYQLTRSALFRLQKLHALYMETEADPSPLLDETEMECFLEKAGRTIVQSANIQHISLLNTKKKGEKNEMPLAGYVGEQQYVGAIQCYLPLLRFMEELGVGNETVFGMGRFEVEAQNLLNRIDENQKNEVENEIKTIERFLREDTEENDNNLPKMLKLSQLIIRFKNKMGQREIPMFAEATESKAIYNNDRFHTHNDRDKQYCYPLIQCKRINGQAAIICFGEGTERIGGLFSSSSEPVLFDNREVTLEIETVKAEKMIVQAWQDTFTYTIRKYLPLSDNYYSEFQEINDLKQRMALIEKILRANIYFFTKSIGIDIDKGVVCEVISGEEKAKVKYKNHTFASFDLVFKTNVSLPNYIGLGIGVSHGHGTVVKKSGL